jgi:hypothetical protein
MQVVRVCPNFFPIKISFLCSYPCITCIWAFRVGFGFLSRWFLIGFRIWIWWMIWMIYFSSKSCKLRFWVIWIGFGFVGARGAWCARDLVLFSWAYVYPHTYALFYIRGRVHICVDVSTHIRMRMVFIRWFVLIWIWLDFHVSSTCHHVSHAMFTFPLEISVFILFIPIACIIPILLEST